AFSDGVLAIAITLLALEIKVPPPPDSGDFSLIDALLKQWPTYLAFFISFFFILVIWISHHRLFTVIRRSDNNLLILNGLLLMCVTLIPFITELVATYLMHPQENVAAVVYSGVFLLTSLFFNLLWGYASHDNRLFDEKTDLELVAFISRQYSFGMPLYLIIVFVAAISAIGSLLLTLGMGI